MKGMSEIADAFEEELRRTQWGNWRLNGSNWTLLHAETHYEVALEEMNSSSHMLDWIIQVSQKTWASPQDKSGLLDALNSIFYPQNTLCSGGMDKRINAREALEKRYKGIEIPPIEEVPSIDDEEEN
jgi:hypothetical protein